MRKSIHKHPENSYTLPVIRLIVSIAVGALDFFIGTFYFHNKILDGLCDLFRGAIILVCIYNVYLSIFYIVDTKEKNMESRAENREVKNLKGKIYSYDRVIELIKNEDIIDIAIKVNNKIVKIGSSSDYDNRTGRFFDKLYFINKTEYKNLDEFENFLMELIEDKDSIEVIKIDDVNP